MMLADFPPNSNSTRLSVLQVSAVIIFAVAVPPGKGNTS